MSKLTSRRHEMRRSVFDEVMKLWVTIWWLTFLWTIRYMPPFLQTAALRNTHFSLSSVIIFMQILCLHRCYAMTYLHIISCRPICCIVLSLKYAAKYKIYPNSPSSRCMKISFSLLSYSVYIGQHVCNVIHEFCVHSRTGVIGQSIYPRPEYTLRYIMAQPRMYT